jgi:tRNA-2-methylthio-N6-dimethylallyladenosine synthase
METYHIVVFGCQMNKSDSERLETILIKKMKLKKASQQEADLVVFVACSVRKSAIDRIWGQTRNLKNQAEQENRKKIIALTGCILPDDKKRFSKKIDIIFDIREMKKMPELVKRFSEEKQGLNLENKAELNQEYLKTKPQHSSTFEAYVPIMNGCNNFCTYCAVPYTRGREISRPVTDVLREIKSLLQKNYKSIILLGQNVNSYRGIDEEGDEISFAQLLEKIDKLKGDFWLNFFSSHPKDLSDELINCFGRLEHLTPYLHLALQSGSDKILKKMNRHYTASDYKKLIKKLRLKEPNISLSTDIIVGFPDETEKDFLATKKVIQDLNFDMTFVARFSPRANTVAWTMTDDVPEETKKTRDLELTHILRSRALEKNKRIIGQEIKVLVESKKDQYFFGKTNQFKNVQIETTRDLKIGEFIEVSITGASKLSLLGKIK